MGEIDLNLTKTPKKGIQVPPNAQDVSGMGYAKGIISNGMKDKRLTNKGKNNRHTAKSRKEAREKAIKGLERYNDTDKTLASRKRFLRIGIVSLLALSGFGKVITSEGVQASINDIVATVFDIDARNVTKQHDKYFEEKLEREHNSYVDTFAELAEYKRKGGNLQKIGISEETFDRAYKYYTDYLILLSSPKSSYDFDEADFARLYEQALKEKIAHAVGYDDISGVSSVKPEDISISSTLHGDGIPFKTTDESITVKGTKYVEPRGILGTNSETHNTIDKKTAGFIKTAEDLKHPRTDRSEKRRFLDAFSELANMLTTSMTQERPKVTEDGVKGKVAKLAIEAGEKGILIEGNHLSIKSGETRRSSVNPASSRYDGDER